MSRSQCEHSVYWHSRTASMNPPENTLHMRQRTFSHSWHLDESKQRKQVRNNINNGSGQKTHRKWQRCQETLTPPPPPTPAARSTIRGAINQNVASCCFHCCQVTRRRAHDTEHWQHVNKAEVSAGWGDLWRVRRVTVTGECSHHRAIDHRLVDSPTFWSSALRKWFSSPWRTIPQPACTPHQLAYSPSRKQQPRNVVCWFKLRLQHNRPNETDEPVTCDTLGFSTPGY